MKYDLEKVNLSRVSWSTRSASLFPPSSLILHNGGLLESGVFTQVKVKLKDDKVIPCMEHDVRRLCLFYAKLACFRCQDLATEIGSLTVILISMDRAGDVDRVSLRLRSNSVSVRTMRRCR